MNPALQSIFDTEMTFGRPQDDDAQLISLIRLAHRQGGQQALDVLANRLEPLVGRPRLLAAYRQAVGLINTPSEGPSPNGRLAVAAEGAQATPRLLQVPEEMDRARSLLYPPQDALSRLQRPTAFPETEPSVYEFDLRPRRTTQPYEPDSPEARELTQDRLQRNSLYENVVGPGGLPTPGGLNHGYPMLTAEKGLPGGRVPSSYYGLR